MTTIKFTLADVSAVNCPVGALGEITYTVEDDKAIEVIHALHLLGFHPEVVAP